MYGNTIGSLQLVSTIMVHLMLPQIVFGMNIPALLTTSHDNSPQHMPVDWFMNTQQPALVYDTNNGCYKSYTPQDNDDKKGVTIHSKNKKWRPVVRLSHHLEKAVTASIAEIEGQTREQQLSDTLVLLSPNNTNSAPSKNSLSLVNNFTQLAHESTDALDEIVGNFLQQMQFVTPSSHTDKSSTHATSTLCNALSNATVTRNRIAKKKKLKTRNYYKYHRKKDKGDRNNPYKRKVYVSH